MLDTVPVTFPVKAPSNVAATNVSEPTVHLSSVSFHNKLLLASSPLSIVIPPLELAEPVAFEFKIMILSANSIVSVLIVVVVPDTVKLPVIVTSPPADMSFVVTSLNVTLSVVPTD